VTASRSRGRRGRSRKRRPAAASTPEQRPGALEAADSGRALGEPGERARRASRRERARDQPAADERPRPPWYPLPLSELLILVGAIGTVIGFSRGAGGRPLLFAGVGAVALGTIEFAVREHLQGYRSHTILLAFIPVVAVHTVLAVALALAGLPATAAALGPLVVDVALFALLFKLLRTRFLDARRERRFAPRPRP
jgi:hypothetical protein